MRNIRQNFYDVFATEPMLAAASPGRINLIGEHTDYNDGFVLPAAIDKKIEVTLRRSSDDMVRLYAVEFTDRYEVNLSDIAPGKKVWPNYVSGVAAQLIKRGYTIGGFDAALQGDIPVGAGLSSSAAVECAMVFALNELFALGIERKEMALIAQKAEHEFAGVRCGIMDQFASMFGKKDHVIKLDCRSLEYEYFPLDLNDYIIVLMDTQVKHSLASGEYNIRRSECERGVELIQKKYPGVKSLRDVSLAQVEECLQDNDRQVYNRCRYVVEEIDRLLTGTKDLENGDIFSFGEKMFATHEGLSKMYEVSCDELDILVNAVKNNAAVAGARMMGGGFGGCTINLIKESEADALIDTVDKIYKEKTGMNIKAWKVSIEDGTHLI